MPGNDALAGTTTQPSRQTPRLVFCGASPLVYSRQGRMYSLEDPIAFRKEAAEIQEAVAGNVAQAATIEVHVASPKTLCDVLTQRVDCLVMHLSCHGQASGTLILEHETRPGLAHPLKSEKLNELLENQQPAVKVVLLNACNSRKAGELFVSAGVRHVVATRGRVGNNAAVAFAGRFYGSLLQGRTVTEAFKTAQWFIEMQNYPQCSCSGVPEAPHNVESHFVLLPEGASHDESVFPVDNVQPGKCELVLVRKTQPHEIEPREGQPGHLPAFAPPSPERNVAVQELLTQMSVARRVISVLGPPSSGKSSVCLQACNYARERGSLAAAPLGAMYFADLTGIDPDSASHEHSLCAALLDLLGAPAAAAVSQNSNSTLSARTFLEWLLAGRSSEGRVILLLEGLECLYSGHGALAERRRGTLKAFLRECFAVNGSQLLVLFTADSREMLESLLALDEALSLRVGLLEVESIASDTGPALPAGMRQQQIWHPRRCEDLRKRLRALVRSRAGALDGAARCGKRAQKCFGGTRRWAKQLVLDELRAEVCNLVVLKAPPGFGKTTVAADLARDESLCAAAYFMDYRSQERSRPELLIASLALQLAHRFPAYCSELLSAWDAVEACVCAARGDDAVSLSLSGALWSEAFEAAVLAPLLAAYGGENVAPVMFALQQQLLMQQQMQQNEEVNGEKQEQQQEGDRRERRLLLVVDGLDEALDGQQQGGGAPILDLVRNDLSRLPSWLCTFCTTRPAVAARILSKGHGASAQEIDGENGDCRQFNDRDAREFLAGTLRPEWFCDATVESAVALLVDGESDCNGGKSGGGGSNFAHLMYVVELLRRGPPCTLQTLGTLPSNVWGIYDDFFAERLPALLLPLAVLPLGQDARKGLGGRRLPPELQTLVRSFLCVVVGAPEPIPVTFLPELLGCDEQTSDRLVEAMSLLFSVQAAEGSLGGVDCVSIHHKSLNDWLQDEARQALRPGSAFDRAKLHVPLRVADAYLFDKGQAWLATLLSESAAATSTTSASETETITVSETASLLESGIGAYFQRHLMTHAFRGVSTFGEAWVTALKLLEIPTSAAAGLQISNTAKKGSEFAAYLPGQRALLQLNGLSDSGCLPHDLRILSAIGELVLCGSQITGPIPHKIGALNRLTRLNLSWNALSGRVPPQLGDLTSLERLYLNDNQLCDEIPAQLGNLRALEILSMERNKLSGSIPPTLSGLMSLRVLDLSNNKLTGEIPAEFGSLANLQRLILHSNRLTGHLPDSLGDLGATLVLLNVRNNRLSGDVPLSLCRLVNLRGLLMGQNAFTGHLPISPDFAKLRELYLFKNHFSGEIPKEIGALTSLTGLCVGANKISGPIPKELGNLVELRELRLMDNRLSGPLPAELNNLVNLKSFQCSGNEALQGPIPPQLQRLTGLTLPRPPRERLVKQLGKINLVRERELSAPYSEGGWRFADTYDAVGNPSGKSGQTNSSNSSKAEASIGSVGGVSVQERMSGNASAGGGRPSGGSGEFTNGNNSEGNSISKDRDFSSSSEQKHLRRPSGEQSAEQCKPSWKFWA